MPHVVRHRREEEGEAVDGRQRFGERAREDGAELVDVPPVSRKSFPMRSSVGLANFITNSSAEGN